MRMTCEEWFAQLRETVAASAASAPGPLRPPRAGFRPIGRFRTDPEKKERRRRPVLADHGKGTGKA